MDTRGTNGPSAFEISGSLLFRNAVLGMVGQALPLLIGLAALPAIIRGLGTERFGILIFTWTLLGAFSVFDLGLGWAVTRFVAEALGRGDSGAIPGIVWSAVAGQAVLGAAGAAVLNLGAAPLVLQFLHVAPQSQAEAILTFRIVGISLPIVLISVSFRGALEAAQRFDVVTGIKATTSASTYLVPLVGVFLGWRLPHILTVMLIVRVLLLAWLIAACSRTLSIHATPSGIEPRRLRRLSSFGAWITVSALAGLALGYGDRFVIGHSLTMSALAYYTVPQDMISRLSVISASLAAVLFPAFSALGGARDPHRLGLLFTRTSRYVILAAGPAFGLIAILAPDLLRLWLGATIAEHSAPVLRILAVGGALQTLAVIPYTMLQGLGRSDLTAKFHLVEAPLYFAAMWWLTRAFGIQGAALAWSGRVVLEIWLLLWAAGRLGGWTRQAAGDTAKQVLAPVAGLCGVSAMVYAMPITLPQRATLLAGLLAAFGWWVWTTVLQADERRRIVQLAEGWRHLSSRPREGT